MFITNLKQTAINKIKKSLQSQFFMQSMALQANFDCFYILQKLEMHKMYFDCVLKFTLR